MSSARPLLSLASHSHFTKRATGDIELMVKLRRQHFNLFYDLQHTVMRDRMMVAIEYDIHKKPQALALLKLVLPLLLQNERFELVMQNLGLISSVDEAVKLYRGMFKPDDFETNAAQRYDFAEAIMPLVESNQDLYKILPHVNKVDHDSLRSKFETQQSDLMAARSRTVSQHT